jgi:hypothetical protein
MDSLSSMQRTYSRTSSAGETPLPHSSMKMTISLPHHLEVWAWEWEVLEEEPNSSNNSRGNKEGKMISLVVDMMISSVEVLSEVWEDLVVLVVWADSEEWEAWEEWEA